jgi:cyclopropane-fatty-acyl-phospholipid synthase
MTGRDRTAERASRPLDRAGWGAPGGARRSTPDLSGVARRLAPLIERFTGGPLPVRLRAWDGSEAGPAGAPAVVLRSPRALRRLLWHPGELGVAQAYVTGDLDVEGDLDQALRLARGSASGHGRLKLTPAACLAAAREAAALGVLGPPPPPPASQARVPRGAGRLHSRRRDRAVIAHHYDLTAEFYRLLLDPAMAYSCARWESTAPGYTLADAQAAKLDAVCRKTGLAEGRTLLDVGCGWGSLAIHAAQHYGARVDAVTLSAGQRDFVTGRLHDLRLAGLVTVKEKDYRDIGGKRYDAIAAIEMGEHVGARDYPAFCARLRGLLAGGGRLLIQQMSRDGRAPGGGPFIESFIAPDMHMRPLGETAGLLEAAGLEVIQVESMRADYGRTIRAWLENFGRHRAEITRLIGAEQVRVWELYLNGGAQAFEQGRMGVHQIVATRRPD